MWSEEMDDSIRDAARNEKPHSFQERSWDGMEHLLDQHLPQKKRRRLIFLFAIIAAGLLVPGAIYLNKKHNTDQATASSAVDTHKTSAPLQAGSDKQSVV